MDRTRTGNSGSEYPPFGEELPDPEVHILGSIMVDPTLLEHVAPQIKPEYFQRELHRRIYRAMLYKYENGIPPNFQSLAGEARPSGLLENVGEDTLLEIAQRIETTAYIDNSVKQVVKRYKRQAVVGLNRQGLVALEKRRNVSEYIKTLAADLDDPETRHETLARPDTDGSRFWRLENEPRPAVVDKMPLPAVDTRPHWGPPRGATKFGYVARLRNRVAKPLALITLVVGAGALAWFAGRWSAQVALVPSARAPVVAPIQEQSGQVAGEVLSSTAKGTKAEELAPQQTTSAPAVVPPAGEAPHASPTVAQAAPDVAQVPRDVMQPSTPVAPRDDAAPRTVAPAPRASGSIYAVNVSSFRNAAGAAAEVAKLQARGYQARAIRTDLESKGVWYRVYVGQYATEAEAKQARAEILEQTDYGTAYVRSIVPF